MSAIDDYWAALERLKGNKPIRLPPGTRINKDTVALEAGRKRGSIKKSRKIFGSLIGAIEFAAHEVVPEEASIKQKLTAEKRKKEHYRELYHNSLNRELMLLDRLAELEKKLKRYDKVVPMFD